MSNHLPNPALTSRPPAQWPLSFHTITLRSGPPTEMTLFPSHVKRTQPTLAACAAAERHAAEPGPHGARKRFTLRNSSHVTSSRPSGDLVCVVSVALRVGEGGVGWGWQHRGSTRALSRTCARR